MPVAASATIGGSTRCSDVGSGPPKSAALLCRLRRWVVRKAKKRREMRLTRPMALPTLIPAAAPAERGEVLCIELDGPAAALEVVVVAAASVSEGVEVEENRKVDGDRFGEALGSEDAVDEGAGTGDAVGRGLVDVVVTKDELAAVGGFPDEIDEGGDGIGTALALEAGNC